VPVTVNTTRIVATDTLRSEHHQACEVSGVPDAANLEFGCTSVSAATPGRFVMLPPALSVTPRRPLRLVQPDAQPGDAIVIAETPLALCSSNPGVYATTVETKSAQGKTPLLTPSKASRIHQFGGPEVITLEDMVPPDPGEGEVLVRVKAAGVGPWDGWIRAGQSAQPQPSIDLTGSPMQTRPLRKRHDPPKSGQSLRTPKAPILFGWQLS
jgi:hypothetical protein